MPRTGSRPLSRRQMKIRHRATPAPVIRGGDRPSPDPPVLFTLPGVSSDVLLHGIRVDYHVHSSVLKMYSGYFRRFLEYPEQYVPAGRRKAPGSFKYEYVTVVDEDGMCALEPAAKAPKVTDAMRKRISKPAVEEQALQDLLCAMYHKHFHIEVLSSSKLSFVLPISTVGYQSCQQLLLGHSWGAHYSSSKLMDQTILPALLKTSL